MRAPSLATGRPPAFGFEVPNLLQVAASLRPLKLPPAPRLNNLAPHPTPRVGASLLVGLLPLLPRKRTGISLVVQGQPVLKDLEGFSRLTSVPGDLVVYETSLDSLAALGNVQTIGLSCVVRKAGG